MALPFLRSGGVVAFGGILDRLDRFEFVFVRLAERIFVTSEPEVGSQEFTSSRVGEPVLDLIGLFVDGFDGEGEAPAGHVVLEPKASGSNVFDIGDFLDPQELFLDPFGFVGIFDFGGWGFGSGFLDVGQETVEGFVVDCEPFLALGWS